jgi:hypothetical protein
VSVVAVEAVEAVEADEVVEAAGLGAVGVVGEAAVTLVVELSALSGCGSTTLAAQVNPPGAIIVDSLTVAHENAGEDDWILTNPFTNVREDSSKESKAPVISRLPSTDANDFSPSMIFKRGFLVTIKFDSTVARAGKLNLLKF